VIRPQSSVLHLNQLKLLTITTNIVALLDTHERNEYDVADVA
jgi:hypothetical protein